MKCLECGGTYKKITNTHLKGCCGLTEKEYKEKYPASEMIDGLVKAQYGSAGSTNPNWRGGISSPSCAVCHKKLSRHSTVTHCNRCRSLTNNPFQGKQHTAETRARMVESAKSRPRETYKPGKVDRDVLRKRRKEAWDRIPKEERAFSIRSFIEAGQRCNKKNRDTRIERAVASLLLSTGYKIVCNAQVGMKNVDLLVGMDAIECYGDYWHCNPKLYPEDYYHKLLHMTAKEKWEKDARRNELLVSQGYRILCLWEHDIKTRPDWIVIRLKEFLEKEGKYEI